MTRPRTLLAPLALAALCACGAPRPEPAEEPGALAENPGCPFDPRGDVDCERACGRYADAHAARAAERPGEIVTPDACPGLCEQFNDPVHHAQPDVVVQWGCLAEHPMCSEAMARCQRTCLDAAGLDAAPATFALCLPPEASAGS